MATNANVGLLVPSFFAGQPPTMDEYTSFFRSAEDMGFHSLWFTDRVFHQINILETFTLMTVAATVTSRVRLGTAVLLFVLRHPVLVAKAMATLDHLSGGRVTLGISLGGRDNEFGPMGVSMRRRVSKFTEDLTVMRKLWTERNVTFHGRFYDMDDVNVDPKPVQKSGIPIIIGGSADAVYKRAAEADGWVAGGGLNAEAYALACRKIRQYALDSSRDPNILDTGKLMYVYVNEDRNQAKQRLESFCHAYYGPQYDVDDNCAFGQADECAEFIQSYIDAGAKTILLGPTWPDVAQISRISQEVLPRLR